MKIKNIRNTFLRICLSGLLLVSSVIHLAYLTSHTKRWNYTPQPLKGTEHVNAQLIINLDTFDIAYTLNFA
jgi:hypothetical protein